MAQRILRPLGYGDILDELFDLYRRHFLLFFGMAAVVLLPLNVIIYALAGDSAQLLEIFIIGPIGFVVTAAATRAVSEAYLGRTSTILGSYRAIRGRVWSFFSTMVVTSIIIGLGNVMCLIPGIILAIHYAFVSQVFVLEAKTEGNARRRSKELGDGHGLRIFVMQVLSQIMITVIAYAFVLPATIYFADKTSAPGAMLTGSVVGLANGLASSLTLPIQVIAFVLLYYDLRVRKEGFDIEMLAAGMTDSPDPQSAS